MWFTLFGSKYFLATVGRTQEPTLSYLLSATHRNLNVMLAFEGLEVPRRCSILFFSFFRRRICQVEKNCKGREYKT